MSIFTRGGCRRFSFALPFLAVLALVLLERFFAPEAAGWAPVPAKKKDKYDRAIDQGLEWLALHQAEDGHWSLHAFSHHARAKPLPEGKIFTCDCETDCKNRSDIAATAFGLLPFLAAGYGPQPSRQRPDYSKPVAAGLKYLRDKQEKDGSFGTHDMYEHGLATRTLCDAYALSKDDKLKGPAQKALDFIVEAQDDKGGGWRYQPKQAGDLSVTGWQWTALKHGQLAGLKVPRQTLKLAERFLDSCESFPLGREFGGGAFGYVPGAPPSVSMTAVGLLCRQYTGVGPKNPALQAGARRLQRDPPGKNRNLYYLYYANKVMYNRQGDIWRFWDTGINAEGEKVHPGMRNWLLEQQDQGDREGHAHQIGSWKGTQGGRIMATSLALLILEQAAMPPLSRHKPAIGE